MTADRRFPLLLACFFGSGFAALVYQTAWTRQFAFVFGTSELAVATVLAGYMAGLAAGAAVAARLAPRIRRPVLAYAVLELGIAVTALLVPAALLVARALYVAVFTGADLADEGGLWRSLFYLACSFVILAVPTSLMGATLPLLARYAVRSDDELGRRVGTLYTVNTLGAVAGTIATAFALLPALGLSGSVYVAVAANAAVFIGGALLARGAGASAPGTPAPAIDAAQPSASEPGREGLILPIMLLSGAASFAYEVLWTRLLSHILGGSVYAFATMLAAFLVGIAAGAAVASRLASDRARAAAAFAWAQAGTAALSIAAFLVLDWMPQVAQTIAGAGPGTLLSDAAVAAIILLPGTTCIGATFPLAVRILAPDERAATAASARVYAWNTVGAVIGAVGTGFFLLPWWGFAGTMSAAAACNLALGLAAAALLVQRRPRGAWAAAAGWTAALGLAAVVAVQLPRPWRILRSSPFQHVAPDGTPVFLAIGRGATVLMLRVRGAWELRTNGLPESAIQPRGALEVKDLLPHWLAALPSLARPEARRMMVVGFGGGVLLESVPASVERIDVVEIEPQVVHANRTIAPWRARDPLADPRVRIIVNDARDALTLSGDRYDAIVSQPSHPWTAGSANLYTREFFALAADRLSPQGVLAQWMGLNFVDAALLRSLVATIREVFPHVRVYRPFFPGVIFLASKAPFDFARSVPEALAADPDGYARLGIGCLEDLESVLVLDEEGAAAFSRDAAPITDDRNLLATRSPATVRATGPAGMKAIGEALAPHDALLRDTPGLERDTMVHRLLTLGFLERAALGAEHTADPAMHAVCRSWVAVGRSDPKLAGVLVDEALALDGDLRAAWLLRMQLDRRPGAGTPAVPERPDVLRDSDLAVIEGWTLRDTAAWERLRALEDRLAAAGPCDPLYEDALRLRAAWRIAEGTPDLAVEAMALVDRVLASGRLPQDLLLRAHAVAAAGQWPGLVATLYAIAAPLDVQPFSRPAARMALDIIDAAEARGAAEPEFADLRARFNRGADPPQAASP
jgi:spermidine synthase